MTYDELIREIANRTGQTQQATRDTLSTLPEVLMASLEMDEWVQTPCGTFRKKMRKSKRVRSIQSGDWIDTDAKVIINLKPGTRLTQVVSDSD